MRFEGRTMSTLNDSLLYGFDYDRKFLLDATESAQTILPIVNVFAIHPAVLFLVKRRKSMSIDIRIGYISTVIGLMLSDCIIFGLRVHLLSPFAGIYCGGPLCKNGVLDASLIRVLLALSVICCFPCFLFLTVRLHQMVLRGSDSRWILRRRTQLISFFVLLAIVSLNLFGFYIFALTSEKAGTIQQSPELAWICERSGTLLIFGDFGEPEHMKYELLIMGVSIATHAPIVIAFSVHSMKKLEEYRRLKGALLHVLTPIVTFMITIIFDGRRLLPDSAHAAMRFFITMLFITNPLQFSLVFILKTRGFSKRVSRLKPNQFWFPSTLGSKGSSKAEDQLSCNSTPLLLLPSSNGTDHTANL